jgi:hypothetical protein
VKEGYSIELSKNKYKLKLRIDANDSGHAQAQAVDICRALQAQSYQLDYAETEPTELSTLFKRLSTNEFTHKECCLWKGKHDKDGYPCIYAFRERYYIRHVILRYLDIPKEDSYLRLTCDDKDCINPFHFSYAERRNEKFTSGDTKLMLAYASQGVSVIQIAKAFNVHRSTIYRKLERERIHPRSSSNRNC